MLETLTKTFGSVHATCPFFLNDFYKNYDMSTHFMGLSQYKIIKIRLTVLVLKYGQTVFIY